jgi:hypothetical protein
MRPRQGKPALVRGVRDDGWPVIARNPAITPIRNANSKASDELIRRPIELPIEDALLYLKAVAA